MLSLLLLVTLPADAEKGKPDREAVIKGTRTVLAAIRAAARENRRQDRPAAGEKLTDLYIQAAARAARKLPEATAGRAFLLALGVGLDTSGLMRSNLLVGATWRQVESNEERRARLAVLGEPQAHGRHDLVQHFAVSAALTALLGEKAAESAGVLKEVLDAQGGSGFSFADLAADLSGITLARSILARPARLAVLEKRFAVAEYILPPKGLPEGLKQETFEKRYGSVRDARYRKMRDDLVRRIGELAGYRKKEEKDGAGNGRAPGGG